MRTIPAFTASYSGFVNGDTAANLTAQASLTTSATSSSTVGLYPINASGASSRNYTIAYVPGTLAITKAGTTAASRASRSTRLWSAKPTRSRQVGPQGPGTGSPTGQVTFLVDGTPIGTVALNPPAAWPRSARRPSPQVRTRSRSSTQGIPTSWPAGLPPVRSWLRPRARSRY